MKERCNELFDSVTIDDWERWEAEKKGNQEIIGTRSGYIDFPSISYEQIEEHIRELFIWHESGNMVQQAIINMKAYVQNEEYLEYEEEQSQIQAQLTAYEIIMHIQYQVRNNLI